jgi:cytochrome P450
MCAETYAEIANWTADEKRDLHKVMMRLTLHDRGPGEKALLVILPWALLGPTMAGVLPSLPVIYPPRGKAAIARLNRLVLDVIVRRRAEGGDRGDLLSMLLAARDEDGSALSDDDICAEALTLLLSGHDTSANTLSWAWHLLTQNPEVQEALHEEVTRFVGDRPVTPEDLPKLALAEQVIRETLRLYPVVWIGDPVPQKDMELDGYAVPKAAA